jgi:signal peptidase I
MPRGQGEYYPVSDLKLSLSYSRLAGSGPLELSLSKREDIFTARLLPDAVELVRATEEDPTKTTVVARKPWKFDGRPVRVDFMNLDYRVRLLIDGEEALSTTPADYAPDARQLMQERTMPSEPEVSVTARQQVCGVTHLSLWRDVYYTARGERMLRGGPENPVVLGKDEYFALGDNSPLSQDGRYWTDAVDLPAEGVNAQAGVVPARFLLGKALLVYWPAGYRLYYDKAPDLVPNFGEMRFIH